MTNDKMQNLKKRISAQLDLITRNAKKGSVPFEEIEKLSQLRDEYERLKVENSKK